MASFRPPAPTRTLLTKTLICADSIVLFLIPRRLFFPLSFPFFFFLSQGQSSPVTLLLLLPTFLPFPSALRHSHDATRHFQDFVLGTLQQREPKVLRQVANDLKTKNSTPHPKSLSAAVTLRRQRWRKMRWSLNYKRLYNGAFWYA